MSDSGRMTVSQEREWMQQEVAIARGEAERLRTELASAVAERDAAVAIVRRLQFSHAGRRCPVCAGWNVGPNGETDFAHTADCDIAALLNRRDAALAERDRLADRVKELEGDISHAVTEAKRRCPDYPWQLNTASESVWALGESWLGASAAVDYISKRHVIERERLESALAAAVKERDEAYEALRPFAHIAETSTVFIGSRAIYECAAALLARRDAARAGEG